MVDLAANEKTVHADFYNGEYFAINFNLIYLRGSWFIVLACWEVLYYQHISFLSNKPFCLPVPEIDFKFIYYVVQFHWGAAAHSFTNNNNTLSCTYFFKTCLANKTYLLYLVSCTVTYLKKLISIAMAIHDRF